MPATPSAAAARPFVSIIVPCRNEAAYIGPMLDSVLANDYPRDRLEILIVDGLSEDGTRAVIAAYAARHPVIRVLDNPHRTTPHALNLGIGRARGDIIMRMDAHASYPPNYIAGLVACMEQTGADSVGAAWVPHPGDATVMARAIAAALAHPFGNGNARYRFATDRPREVDTLQCATYRRQVFERLGRFDEDLLRSQDSEFTFRLLRAGGRVVLAPGVVARYYVRASLRKVWRMFFQYGYFKPLVARKVGAVMTARQLVPALFVTTLLLAALAAPWLAPARGLLVLALGAYGAADVVAAASVAGRAGILVGLASLLVFPVVHLAFGIAYLAGTLDFVIRGRRDVPTVSLSR
ncbi:MAG TPA: glycosyltransferase family 2 protein [Gemmatimonadales bacterium]|nr:glycosyltransferase family 2 protein [Gemmatimonadales bacterium]